MQLIQRHYNFYTQMAWVTGAGTPHTTYDVAQHGGYTPEISQNYIFINTRGQIKKNTLLKTRLCGSQMTPSGPLMH